MENFNYTNDVNTNAAAPAAEANATFQPASAGAPAGFAINATSDADEQKVPVHKLEVALTAGKLISETDKLIERRKIWEDGAFKSSTTELLGLLADGLGLRLHLNKFDDARVSFNKLYEDAGYESTKSTALTTKVVRYVFGGHAKKREFAYAKALNVAIENGVQPEAFAQFVADHGGLEELRRNGADAGAKRQERDDKIKNTAAVLKTSTPIAQQLPIPQGLQLEGKTNFVAAIMRKESDGTLSVVHVSANETLIESLLANAAKDIKKTTDSNDYLNGRANAANPTNNQ